MKNNYTYLDCENTESIAEKLISDAFILCSGANMSGDEQLVDGQWFKPRYGFKSLEKLVTKIEQLKTENEELRRDLAQLYAD